MTSDIAILLAQDGLVSGTIYALLALAFVLVYSVTRVLLLPQGAFVTFGALTMAAFEAAQFPKLAWLVLALGCIAFLMDAHGAYRQQRRILELRRTLAYLVYPLAILGLGFVTTGHKLPLIAQVALTLAVVIPVGPYLYRVVFQPIARKPVLVLFNISVAADLVLSGLALVAFGPEGFRTTPITEGSFNAGPVAITGQSVWVVATTVVLILLLYVFFERTIYGKALRATAVNALGARLVGIRTQTAGVICFALAAGIGAVSGILIAPLTTVYYNSGFLIGLKGFVAAIFGGLASYPVAAAGAIVIGLVESFASFGASALKEAIVFALILPFLAWRSLRHVRTHEEDE